MHDLSCVQLRWILPRTIGILIASIFCFTASVAQSWKVVADEGDSARVKKNYTEAFSNYSKAKEMLMADSLATRSFATVCRKIADMYIAKGEAGMVISFYLKSKKEINSKAGTDNIASILLCDYIGMYYYNTNPPLAEAYLIEAKNTRKKLFTDSSIEYSVSTNMLGGYYSYTGQYETALSYHLKTRKIREAYLTSAHPEYAQVCNNTAVAYWYMGEYEKAEALALEAKAIRKEIPPAGFNPVYAITCVNLGNIYRDMGQYDKSESYYLLAKEIREKSFPHKNESIAAVTNSLGDLYAYMGMYEKAEPLYLDAREITSALFGTESAQYALNRNNLADMYSAMGRYAEAETLFLEAKQIWDSTLENTDPTIALNRNSLGSLYFSMNEFEKAAAYLKEARQLWDSAIGKTHPYYAKNTYNIAKVYWNMGRLNEAKKLYNEAFKAEYNQLTKFFRFTNETEKQQYLDNIISSADENLSFYFKNKKLNGGGEAFTLALSNKALILFSSQELRKLILTGKNDSIKKQYEDWTGIKQRISNLYIHANGSNDLQLKDLEWKADSIETILSRSSSGFRNATQPKVNWKDIKSRLLPGEAAIEFSQFRYFNGKEWTDSIMYAGLLLTKESASPIIISLFEKKQLDSLMKGAATEASVSSFYTRGIKKKHKEPNGKRAYQLIWLPLQAHLKGIRTIYYSPAGILHRVSFAALPVDDKNLLSDHYKLVQLSTTALIAEKAFPVTRKKDIVLFGSVQYGNEQTPEQKIFEYLPGTEEEVTTINTLAEKIQMPCKLIRGTDATEASFKNLSGLNSPAILHVATHGFFSEGVIDTGDRDINNGRVFHEHDNPLLRSGLAFAGANQSWNGKTVQEGEDGILTAYEISNMFLPSTQLVVLSACETALGDIKANEGVFGLQRAFKMAGANYLLMSLWEVPDNETAEFMKTFYSHFFKSQSVTAAFSTAQTSLKNKYRSEPYKWAAWILVR